MSKWTDPRIRQLAISGWGSVKGMRQAVKQIKRAEACIRNAATLPERRRAYRRQRQEVPGD